MENKTIINIGCGISDFGVRGSWFRVLNSTFDIRHSIFDINRLEFSILSFAFQLSNFRFLTFAFLLSFLLTTPIQAQTLDDYLILAAENNPGLKSKYSQYLASVERISQPGLPDPELSIGVFIEPMERYMGNQTADYRVMQMFPWFGSIKTQRAEAKHMAQAQYQLFLEAKNQLFNEVKSTWYDLHRIKGQMELNQENLEYLQKLEALAITQFQASTGGGSSSSGPRAMPAPTPSSTGSASGMNGMNTSNTAGNSSPVMSTSTSTNGMGNSASGMASVLEIRLEIKELENQLSLLKSNLNSQTIKFNQLINREINAEIKWGEIQQPATLQLEKMSLLDSIRKNNPMLAMYDEESLAFEQQAKMAKLDGNPMFGLGVNYIPFLPRENDGIDHSMHSMNMVMPMFTMTMPIYRNKTEARIKEAQLLQESAVFSKQQTENLLAMQWANAFREFDDASRTIQLIDDQLDLVQQQINLLTTSLSSSTESLSSIFRAQQRLVNYKIQRLNAITQQYQSLSSLEALSGTTLISN